jgi:spoIIIJ-associated protein
MNGEAKEFYAETVEAAVERAARNYGISPDNLDYEVVDEGSSGFLGIGARDARIAVRATSVLSTEGAPQDESPAQPESSSLQPETSLSSDEVAYESPANDSEAPEEHREAPEELLEEIRSFTGSAVEAMDIEARIDVYDAGDYVAVDVATPETGLFIGQKGETIDALQHLVNASVYRGRTFIKRVIIDSEGYRQRRVEAVQGIAHRSARRAFRERRTVDLPPMSASERRIVHVYLRDDARVETSSEGAGERRHVKITPKR